jgi:phage tail-like protein
MALERKDPYQAFNFSVEIDGINRAGFKGATGLDSSTAPTKYREGTDATLASRQLPGLLTMSNVTLTRGITDDRSLWDWRDSVAKGRVQRKNVSIVLRDDVGVEKVRWNLRDAWPTKWGGPSFEASTDSVAIETLEFAHEGVEVQKWT